MRPRISQYFCLCDDRRKLQVAMNNIELGPGPVVVIEIFKINFTFVWLIYFQSAKVELVGHLS